MTEWVLFDYGVGNLHSLRKALAAAGASTRITSDVADLQTAGVAVLPGVGAFGHVMASLGTEGADILRARHDDGRPILGVCIGKQILYAGSDESPEVAGIGILDGHVGRLPASAGTIPHMGWNPIIACAEDPVIQAAGGQHVYYVHSYAAPVSDDTIASTSYGGPFSAAVRRGNTLAFQFHPEKSSATGADILRRTVADLSARAEAS